MDKRKHVEGHVPAENTGDGESLSLFVFSCGVPK